jgi:two-component system KDP operon response regulator KdpE
MSRVLIIEDDLATQFALRTFFTREGWGVSHARTIASALPQLEPPPDWIILDLGLADGDGETILRYVRSAGIPSGVLVLSGQLDADRLAALQPLRPAFVFRKPIHFEDLLMACRGEASAEVETLP